MNVMDSIIQCCDPLVPNLLVKDNGTCVGYLDIPSLRSPLPSFDPSVGFRQHPLYDAKITHKGSRQTTMVCFNEYETTFRWVRTISPIYCPNNHDHDDVRLKFHERKLEQVNNNFIIERVTCDNGCVSLLNIYHGRDGNLCRSSSVTKNGGWKVQLTKNHLIEHNNDIETKDSDTDHKTKRIISCTGTTISEYELVISDPFKLVPNMKNLFKNVGDDWYNHGDCWIIYEYQCDQVYYGHTLIKDKKLIINLVNKFNFPEPEHLSSSVFANGVRHSKYIDKKDNERNCFMMLKISGYEGKGMQNDWETKVNDREEEVYMTKKSIVGSVSLVTIKETGCMSSPLKHTIVKCKTGKFNKLIKNTKAELETLCDGPIMDGPYQYSYPTFEFVNDEVFFGSIAIITTTTPNNKPMCYHVYIMFSTSKSWIDHGVIVVDAKDYPSYIMTPLQVRTEFSKKRIQRLWELVHEAYGSFADTIMGIILEYYWSLPYNEIME